MKKLIARGENKMKKHSKMIWGTYYALFIMVALWGICSWVEVIAKNTTPDPVYSPANLIVLFTMLF